MISSERNYYAFLWHATFLALTAALTEVNTVLPALIVKSGGGSTEIGLLTAIMVGTPIVGQLLFAGYLHLKPKKKGFLLLGIGLRVVALAIVSAVLVAAADMAQQTLISLVFVLMFVFALSGAFAGVSYADILGKSLAAEQRGSFFVNRQLLTSLAMLASAPLPRWILGRSDYPFNYAWMFALAAVLLFVAAFGFWAIDEPTVRVETNRGHTFWTVLRSIPGYLREDAGLLRYILLINLTGFGLTLMPFYIAYGSRHYGLSGEQVGTYLLVQIGGMILSSFFWSRMVKRFGFRGVVRGCILCGSLLPLLALWLAGKPLILFLLVFFLMGVAVSARKIAFEGLFIEISNNDNRALYKGIVGATSLTTALFPLLAGGLIDRCGYAPVFGAGSFFVALAWLTLNAQE